MADPAALECVPGAVQASSPQPGPSEPSGDRGMEKRLRHEEETEEGRRRRDPGGSGRANPTSPSLFPLSLRSVDDARNVVIGCLVKGFFPSQPLSVTWSQSGQDASVRNFSPVLNTSGGGLYTMISQLTLPASQCPAGTTKTCQVQHLSSSSKSVAVPCIGCSPPPTGCCQPKLSLRRPAIEDLLLGSSANLTCTLSGLEKGQEATFTWEFSGRKNAIQGAPQPDASGCYSVSSVLPDSAEAWNSGDTFSCTATYSGATNGPLTVTITKPRGNSFRPQVHLLPPPSEELALNELVTLTCLVRGFSPEDLLLRWLHGNQELAREKYLVWAPRPEAGQGAATFAVTSVLRVEAEKWKSGDNFSCMVGHEALPMAFTQKTIDRLAAPQCLADCPKPPPWVLLDLSQENLEEDAPGASLWPTTVTLLTLFLLSLFYSTALTVTSVRAPPGSTEGPQY